MSEPVGLERRDFAFSCSGLHHGVAHQSFPRHGPDRDEYDAAAKPLLPA